LVCQIDLPAAQPSHESNINYALLLHALLSNAKDQP
jgi:hypothetical protein